MISSAVWFDGRMLKFGVKRMTLKNLVSMAGRKDAANPEARFLACQGTVLGIPGVVSNPPPEICYFVLSYRY